MNEVFWLSWEAKEKLLKKQQPQCTCNGGRKRPAKSYHYANCSYLQFWDKKFREHWDSVKTRKTVQLVMETFLKKEDGER